MCDILAEGQSVAPREVLICLLNLSSGGSKLGEVVIGELAVLLHSALTVHGRKAEWVKTNEHCDSPLQCFVALMLFLMWIVGFSSIHTRFMQSSVDIHL